MVNSNNPGDNIRKDSRRKVKMGTDKSAFSIGLGAKVCHNWAEIDGTPAELNALFENTELLRQVREIQLGRCEIKVVNHTVDLDANPFLPNDWKVEEHKKGGQWKFDPRKLELYLDDSQKDGKCIEGNKLRKKLVAQNVFNANLLDFLLKNPHLIPESWRGKVIFFWGTVYRNADGDLCVRYLDWYGLRWHWYCLWLGRAWAGLDPAVVLGK